MRTGIRQVGFAVAGLCSGALALGQLQIENAAVGQRTLVITVDDSIQAPDLAKIRVEGYEIENVVFVEDMSPNSTTFAPNYLDLTLPGGGKVVDYVPTPGTLVLDLPEGTIPVAGTVVADTSFGGIFRKVVEVGGQPQPGLLGHRWTLRTVDANLPDAVQDCDIAFKTRMDMNLSLADMNQSQDVIGTGADGATAYGQLGIGMSNAQVLFQPTVTGRIRMRAGNVELFQFNVTGDCDVMATVKANVSGSGDFDYEEELAGKPPALLPLGAGLFLRVQNQPSLHVEAHARSESFSALADFHIRNSIKGELGFTGGQWRPLAENKMTMADKTLRDLTGDGQVKFSLKPRVEMLLNGVQGPVFTFEPYAKFTASPSPLPVFAWAQGAWPAPGGAFANVYPLLPLTAATVPGSTTVAAPVSGWQTPVFAKDDGKGVADSAGAALSNKELGLGANIFMETRTNFTGPDALRNFLLFSREQTVFSPPKEGTLTLKEADSNRIFVQCQTYPKSDYYMIQQKVGSGPWETILDKAIAPQIRANLLKPGTLYRFRALGVNALGISPAFPPEGVPFLSPSANHPPFQPLARFPDSGSMVPDSLSVALAWSGGDPDAGAKVQYTVYLDAKYPPLSIRAAGLNDTSLSLTDLKPGTTYFWKVIASDGIDKSEGLVRSFTTKSVATVPQLPKAYASAYPVVYLPKGSFRREDGQLVQVGPLFLGRFEVTQVEYQKVTGSNPSYRLQDSLPVDKVTWEEADNFCRETGGRLPTEAEWEYAARAGSNSSYYWGEKAAGDYAWYRDNSDNSSQKVGQKKPNAWGLHDMAGNVFEWVQDWYGDYSATDLDHPKGPATGTAKVIRGASWYSESSSLSLSARYNNRPSFSNFKVGFRCAKDPERTVFMDAPPALASKSAGPAAVADTVPAK